jgi:Fe-S-cluster containining protein
MSTPKPVRGARLFKFRCTDCGNCCTDTIVPVTEADVLRLMKGTGLPALEFIDFFERSDFDDDADDLGWVKLDEGLRAMALRKAEGQEACGFLKDLRCSVYPHRPITCRIYPHNLRFDATGAISRVFISEDVPCPYELDGKVDRAALVANWHLDDRQDEAYHAKVRAFNEGPGPRSRADFLRYLGLDAVSAPKPQLMEA